MAIQAPNTFQLSNDIVKLLPLLTEAELKVYLVITYKIVGFHKERDFISLSQLEQITGLSRPSVISAVEALEGKSLIVKQVRGIPGNFKTFYELKFIEKMEQSPLVKNVNQEQKSPVKNFNQAQERLVKNFNPHGYIYNNQVCTSKVHDRTTNPPTPQSSKGLVGGFKIYSFLEELQIKHEDKIRLTNDFSEKTVQQAVAYVSKPTFKTQKSLDSAIFYFCKNPDHMTPDKQDLAKQKQIQQDQLQEKIAERKYAAQTIAKEVNSKVDRSNPHWFNPINVLQDCIELITERESFKLYYKEINFTTILEHFLRKIQAPKISILAQIT